MKSKGDCVICGKYVPENDYTHTCKTQEPIKDENLLGTATFTNDEMKRFTGETTLNDLLKPQEPINTDLEVLKKYVEENIEYTKGCVDTPFRNGSIDAYEIVLERINSLMRGE